MTQPQQQLPELVLTDPEAADALQDVGFLGQFREATSPSDAARKLGMPANLAHHHAQKYLRLGLLFEAGREKGKVLYQLVALTFSVPNIIQDRAYERSVNEVNTRYREAYERSISRQVNPRDRGTTCHFGEVGVPSPVPTGRTLTHEPRPAYRVERTLMLTPERYRALLLKIELLLQNEESQRDVAGAEVCTLSALAFEGSAREGVADSLSVSSFLDLQGEQA